MSVLLGEVVAAIEALGDASDGSYVDATALAGALPTIAPLLVASSMAVSGLAGAVEHVVFGVRLGATASGGSSIGDALLRWGSSEEMISLPADLGIEARESAPSTAQPGGAAWNFPALEALTMEATADAVLASHGQATLRVARLYARVYGPDPDAGLVGLNAELLAGDLAVGLEVEE